MVSLRRRPTVESASPSAPLVATHQALPAGLLATRWTLRLTPGGNLLLSAAPDSGDGTAEAPLPPEVPSRLVAAFADGAGAGLCHLGAVEVGTPLPAALAFFRDFAQRLIHALCSLPDADAQLQSLTLPPPPLAAWVAAAPPMIGLEYLNEQVLERLWQAAVEALQAALVRFAGPLAEYLRQQNPAWNVVGRICLHLAENRRDEAAPFAFLATYARGVRQGGDHKSIQHVPLGQALREYAGAEDKPALLALLAPLKRAAEQSPFLHELVDSGRIYHPLRFSPTQAYRLLGQVPTLESAGVVVRLPDFWKAKRPVRPQVEVRIGEQPVCGSATLLDFSVQVALGDEQLSEAEWQELLASREPLIRLRGQWVEVDRHRLPELLAHWRAVQAASAKGGISFIDGMRLLAGAPIGGGLGETLDLAEGSAQWSRVVSGAGMTALLKQLRDPTALAAVDEKLGQRLRATLRPYQQLGVRWLAFITALGLGGCLADDMGLGKTVQVLALLLLRQQSAKAAKRPALLVAPASLLGNWLAESSRFAPDLRVLLCHPAALTADQLERLNADRFAAYDLVVTSYGFVQRLPALTSCRWGLLVLDEAQAIKNPAIKQTRAVKALRSDVRLALTGTPIENRLSDLWSLFDFLNPGLLGSAADFGRFVQRLNQRRSSADALAPAAPPAYAALRELCRPYILRRMKSDPQVITDLPDKTEVVAYCNLSRTQATLYQRAVSELGELLATLDGIERRGAVLSCLMRLKQICNHPMQALGHGTFAEAESGKLLRLREICEAVALRQEKVLVFTQFRELCVPLAEFLAGVFGRPGLILSGQTPVGKRQQLVDSFQQPDSGSGPPFFVLSLKAGGTGLNLTAAAHVVHFDRWWNPAVEDQATDRAYRIGQHRNVLVHKLVCRGTLEERVDSMLRDKRSLASEVLSSGGELPLTELTDGELLKLLSLDIGRALADS